MFYLEFRHIDDFSSHLKNNGIKEAFVYVRQPKETTTDIKFREAVYTARVDNCICLCAWGFHYRANLSPEEIHSEVEHELDRMKERLQRNDIEVRRGRWLGTPPSSLLGEEPV